MSEKFVWSSQLDWLNIINMLGLDTVEQIPELKKEKALRKLHKLYGTEVLLSLLPHELDELVAGELRNVMKKELTSQARKKAQEERAMQDKLMSFKKGNVIGINMNDLKDLDPNASPEDIFKYLSKKFLNNDDDDEDDDTDRYDEDKSGYYI